MEFIKRVKDRAPEYDSSYKDLITKFTITQGGTSGTATEADKWSQGKYFSTQYEIYMYATLIGLKKDYKLPLAADVDTNKFIEIKSWQPQELADYIIMGVLAKSNLDFNALEDLEDKEVEKEITNLKKEIEAYANGGFDKIRSKMEVDPAYFDNNDNCFLDFLED